MTNEELNQIEEALNVTLPSIYRKIAIDGMLIEPLHNDPKSIIFINMAFRRGDFGDTAWPENLIAFGHDGAGNYYCLDLASDTGNVYMRDHETLSISFEAGSLTDLLQ